jgi:thiamine biosynthesis protein ThiS
MITVGEEKIPWKAGMTVAQVMEAIEDGHKYAVVRLNGKPVSRPNFDKTPVPDESEVIPIPMVAGG